MPIKKIHMQRLKRERELTLFRELRRKPFRNWNKSKHETRFWVIHIRLPYLSSPGDLWRLAKTLNPYRSRLEGSRLDEFEGNNGDRQTLWTRREDNRRKWKNTPTFVLINQNQHQPVCRLQIMHYRWINYFLISIKITRRTSLNVQVNYQPSNIIECDTTTEKEIGKWIRGMTLQRPWKLNLDKLFNIRTISEMTNHKAYSSIG